MSKRSVIDRCSTLLGIPCKDILRDINVLVTIAPQYDLGRMIDERAIELTSAQSLGPYLRYLLEPELVFGGTSSNKAVTGTRESCATA